ncbi:hypothetical protein HDU78_004989 [Chytriomyces hyalinus]|uniref:Uncharacterized protein n=1 Tax=Chytriomyces confervae TaxID=246404 RepID=A0A507F008_9FUNG|nr:hypothetical protein HDU78_004989 [Chytriomyces hyalinus]KAJ3263583.1 hypothetical protein HDU77_010405 [Chytriomyces hyalinus]KAJ3406759.1 hypothetical protein HDU80_010442 [Chytriomyces hyalinus]TPX69005.1 hypothetical protein CcCBS67573_g06955 [Chytriomyces confervae]
MHLRRLSRSLQSIRHHSSKPTPLPANKQTKEEWLNIARSWPHEYYSPAAPRSLPSGHVFPDHADGSETAATNASYFTSWHAKALGVGIAAYLTLQWLSDAQKKGTNPLANYVRDNVATRAEIEKEMAQSLAFQQKIADDMRILNAGEPDSIHRLYFPGVFHRRSDFLVEPGSQSSFTDSDVKVKTVWEKDDHLFGPPYPSKE